MERQSRIQTILFDLDGTLIDQFGTIHRSCNHVQKELGLPLSGYEEVKSQVGGSIHNTLEALVGKEYVERAVPLYYEHYEQIIFEGTKLLPGAEWILRELSAIGYQVAIYTNKTGHNARKICNHLGLSQYCERIFGFKDFPGRKPDRVATEYVFKELNTQSESCYFIGDSTFDIDTATNVQMPCLLVATGTHSKEELEAATPWEGGKTVFVSLYELGAHSFGLRSPAYHAVMSE